MITPTKEVSIQQVLKDFTGTNVPAGSAEVSVECPFHNDSSGDSLRVYPATNSANCFGGCGSFQPINIIAKNLGINYQEAKNKYELFYKLRLMTVEEEEQLYLHNAFKPYVEETHKCLTAEHRLQLHARGLTDEFINQHQIGFHPEGFEAVTYESCGELGIYYKDSEGDYYSDFIGKIIIPLYQGDHLITVCAWDKEEEPKYTLPRGTTKTLYGKLVKDMILVEGVFDLLSLLQLGVPAVTTLGASPTNKQLQELTKIPAFMIAFDGDDAGRKGAQVVAGAVYPKATLLTFKESEDPNSSHVALGNQFSDYLELLKNSQEDILNQRILEINQLESKREAAVQFSETCIPLLAKLGDIERDATINSFRDVTKSLGINKTSINKEMKRYLEIVGTAGTDKPKQHTGRLYEKISIDVPLFIDETKDSYAQIPVNDGKGKQTVRIKSEEFKRYVRRTARAESGGDILATDSLGQLVSQFDADAHDTGKQVNLQNRAAWHNGDIYYDMSNGSGTAICISKTGWSIDETNLPLFKTEHHQLPQVLPVAGGDLRKFLELFHLSTDNVILISVWMVYQLIPDVPKPILYVQAEKGSGKTDLTRAIRSVIDPSSLSSLKEPNNEDRLVNQLYHHYVPLFDNISYMPRWFIRLCTTTATGESDERRRLFTDDDAFILTFTRGTIINAINRFAINYPDFQDRTVLIKMERIAEDKRLEHSVVSDLVEEAKPGLFGVLLDTLSNAMSIKETIELPVLPRMADFALWGAAIAESLGYTQQEFLDAYSNNMRLANEEMIYDHVVAHTIFEFMRDKAVWHGRPSDFLEELKDAAIDLNIDIGDKMFPKSASILTRRLIEIKSNLEDVGIEIHLPRQSGGKRLMSVFNTEIVDPVVAEDNLSGVI